MLPQVTKRHVSFQASNEQCNLVIGDPYHLGDDYQFDTHQPDTLEGDNEPGILEHSVSQETMSTASSSDKFQNTVTQQDGKFMCSLCPMVTKAKNDLLRHLRTHTGEKPFKCFFCKYRCSRKTSLKKHCFCIHQLGKHEFDSLAKIHLPNTS